MDQRGDDIAVLRHIYPASVTMLILEKHIQEFRKEFRKAFKNRREGTIVKWKPINIHGQYLLKFPPRAEDMVMYNFKPVKRQEIFYDFVTKFCTSRNLSFFVPKNIE